MLSAALQVYASELRVRQSSSDAEGELCVRLVRALNVVAAAAGTTVEWTATIVVRDQRIVQAVSEEYEKGLATLRTMVEESTK